MANVFETSWFFSVAGGAAAGIASSHSSGVTWGIGGLILGGVTGAATYFGLGLISAALLSSSGLDCYDQATPFQNVAMAIAIGSIVLSPFVAVGASIASLYFLRSLFAP